MLRIAPTCFCLAVKVQISVSGSILLLLKTFYKQILLKKTVLSIEKISTYLELLTDAR